jgi:hypothetical protein
MRFGVKCPPLQTLVVCHVRLEPLLREGIELARSDHAGYTCDGLITRERLHDSLDPLLINHDVIVSECHNRAVQVRQSSVMRSGKARLVLTDIENVGLLPCKLADDLRSL